MENIKIVKEGKTYLLASASNTVKPDGWDVPVESRRNLLLAARPLFPSTWRALWQSLKLSDTPVLSDQDICTKLQEAINRNQVLVVRERVAPKAAKETDSQRKPAPGAATTEPVRAQDKFTSPPPPPSTNKSAVVSDKPACANADAITGAAPEAATETRGCPISMVSGEELLSLVDAELPGPMRFTWKRTYRSGQRRDIGLGVSWTHSACEQILLTNNALDYYDDEGRILPLARPRVGQTSFYLPEGLTLLHPGETRFVLQQDGQPDKVFERIGASGVYRLRQLRHPAYQPANGEKPGFAINFHYNAHNRITRIAGNWGQSLVFERDANGHVLHVDIENETSKARKRLATYTYNEVGELVAHRNANGAGEDYNYSHHLLQQRTLATGFRYYYEWDGTDSNARCLHNWGDDGIYDYRFEWEPENNLSRARDSRGYTTTFKYNEYGLITEEIDNEGAHHRYRYAHGRKIAYIDPLGNETRYFYDEDSRPLGHKDALGHQESLAYFKGKLRRYTDKSKACWQYEHNTHGLLAARIDPYGQRTEYRYNAQGLLSEVREPGNRVNRYQWRVDGYLHRLTDAEGHVREFRYDDWGQVVEVELRLKGKILAGKQHYTYTPTGRLASVTNAQGRSSTYSYNSNDQLIHYCDAQGRSTYFEYDGLSQVVKRIDAEGHTLHYEYDKERNLVALINENGERYCFEYDGNERLIREVGFDGREQCYEYNAAGHLVQHTDAGEIVTAFERDALGRMLTKISRSLADPSREEKSRYAYDAAGRLRESYNANHYLEFEYNLFGKLVREHSSDINDKSRRIKDSARDIRYAWIWPGLRSHMQLPDGQQIRYDYDERHRLTAIHHNSQTVTRIQHDEFGREISREQGALISEVEYDPHSRLQRQTVWNGKNKNHKPIERHYGYDDFGNLSQIKDGPLETRYVYDMLNRLKLSEQINGEAGQKENRQEIFHFDPAGNRLDADAQKSLGNRLAFMGDRKFTYDARGNLIKENRGKEGKLETRYFYNLNNQLIKVEKDGQSTEYTYDPLGRRTQKRDAFGCTRYLWAGDQLVQEQREQLKKTYIFEPETFKPVAMVQDEQIFHYHLDHLGTPRELSANDGKIVWKARYLTYGNVAVKEIEEVENNLRFQGQYFDEETGLHYSRHRYYDPGIGQFTTQDPIGLLGGVNNYQYAPNPTGWVDPLGLMCKEESSGNKNKIIFAGHGEIDPNGSFTMPDGTSLTIYSLPGGVITDDLGQLIEAGNAPQNVFRKQYMSGEAVPDLILQANCGQLNLSENSYQVKSDTHLKEILQSNMGDCDWAACTYIPDHENSNLIFDTSGVYREGSDGSFGEVSAEELKKLGDKG